MIPNYTRFRQAAGRALRLLPLVLAVVLLIALCSCAGKPAESVAPSPGTSPSATGPAESSAPGSNNPVTTPEAPVESDPLLDSPDPSQALPEPVTMDDPVNYLYLKIAKHGEYENSINVWEGEEGRCEVSYNVGERKVGTFDASLFQEITALFQREERFLVDETLHTEGGESAALNLNFRSGRSAYSDYTGEVPEEFAALFERISSFFAEKMADLPVAEVQLTEDGPIDPELKTALEEMMAGARYTTDLYLYGIPSESEYPPTLSLSDSNMVLAGAVGAPEFNIDPFRMEIVSLQDGADPQTVAQDFASNVDWGQWVCVCPDRVWIGVRGNLVLCVIGKELPVKEIAVGAIQNGWQEAASMLRDE